MRYHYDTDTVYIRGIWRAASTGIDGGISTISTIFNRTVETNFDHTNPQAYVRSILAEKGYQTDAFCLLTAVSMKNLCILQYDYITVFVTAGLTNPNPDPTRSHTINIIVTSDESFSDAAILETIITVTEAKADALRRLGRDFTGTTSDAVVVAAVPAKDATPAHTYAGTFTEPGRRIYDAVLHGVMASLDRQENRVERCSPSYFIYSRYGGAHWVEWQKKNCPYYPCHFPGQACDFCYCPFYPCNDPELGNFVDSSSGGKVWACTNCLLLHQPHTAAHLKTHPDVTLSELKNLT